MSISLRLPILLKAARQLGLPSLGLYAGYQIGLRSGFFRRVTPSETHLPSQDPANSTIQAGILSLPARASLLSVSSANLPELLSLADEINQGKVRVFGGPPIPLQLVPPGPLAHWTAYETGQAKSAITDIKWVWESARFGWAITLAQAYLASSDERYAQTFWRFTESFLSSNPPFQGPNWNSAQEVALRLIALVFSIQAFYQSPHTTPDRLLRLSQAIAAHAKRIPPTLIYARAQNNNHLLSEAAGLITASHALPGHPQANSWRRLGRRWFARALDSQIAEDGAYIQHSTNYHRLLLQLALWIHILGEPFSEQSTWKLAEATQWLLKLVDPESGGVPNLGPNDGANILPLSTCPFSDYRPTLQAASLIFRGIPAFPPGPWDDMLIWLDRKPSAFPTNASLSLGENKIASPRSSSPSQPSPHIIRCPNHSSWAYLRAAQFTSRPGHADQLHLDLWWRGLNIAIDPGTFSYNDPAPWDNALSSTHVHNTITIDGKDQMDRVGRFLWLDWAQAEVISQDLDPNAQFERIVARHNGYKQIGVIHQRTVTAEKGGHWYIVDSIQPIHPRSTPSRKPQNSQLSARLHWLLPDWPWKLETDRRNTHISIQLESPLGVVQLSLNIDPKDIPTQPEIKLIRSGEILYGSGAIEPTSGWISPTYQSRFPALSLGYRAAIRLPVEFITEWNLPGSE